MSVACQAQLVNVIAPILTEPGGPAWRQTTFHPFAQAARYARGEVLRVEPSGPVLPTERFGEVPALHATATRDGDGTVTLFAVNRDLERPLELTAHLRALGPCRLVEHLVLSDGDRLARNTADDPGRVRPRAVPGGSVAEDATLHATLPPVSWNVLRLAPRGD